MKYLPMSLLLEDARGRGYAVPSFCIWDAESMMAVLHAAEEMRAPVILMSGPGEFGVLPPSVMGRVGAAVAEPFQGRVAFHLDHGDSISQVQACLDAGYTSVMLDFSTRPYAENCAALKKVVAMARPLGVTVEGEIGHVGKTDAVTSEGSRASTLTEPDEAASYARETGVDALAVSIGNAHGHYTSLPHFDFDRLEAIHHAVGVPLVLHGGSGTADEDLRRAISLGIAKINVATDLLTAVRESLRAQWDAKRNLWTPRAVAEAMQKMADVVRRWIARTGAEGKL